MYQGLEVGWRDSDDSIDVGEYVDESGCGEYLEVCECV